MIKYVIDSYAWIEYFEGTEQGRVVQKILNEQKEIFTHAVTLAEVISRMKRKGYETEEAYRAIETLSRIMITDALFSRDVGLLHAQIRQKIRDFGLGDVYVLALARKMNARILTGDPHFKGFKEVHFLE